MTSKNCSSITKRKDETDKKINMKREKLKTRKNHETK